MDENMNTTTMVDDTDLQDMSPEELDAWVDQELNTPDSTPLDESESVIVSDAAKAEAERMKRNFIIKCVIGGALGLGLGASGIVAIMKYRKHKKEEEAKYLEAEMHPEIDPDLVEYVDNPVEVVENPQEVANAEQPKVDLSNLNINIKTDKGEIIARDDALKQVADAIGVDEKLIKDMFDAGWEASVKFQSETCANDINELAKQAENAKAPLMQQLNEMQASLSSETQRANSQASRANQAEKRAKAAEDKIKELERQLREAKKTPEQRAAEHPGRPENPIWPKDQQPEDNGKEVDELGVERVKVPEVEIPEPKVDTIAPETIEVPETTIDSIVDDLPPVDLTKKGKKKSKK